MKISATVTLKKEVLDPQGKVVSQTLKNMIKDAIPDAEIDIHDLAGEDNHYSATI